MGSYHFSSIVLHSNEGNNIEFISQFLNCSPVCDASVLGTSELLPRDLSLTSWKHELCKTREDLENKTDLEK